MVASLRQLPPLTGEMFLRRLNAGSCRRFVVSGEAEERHTIAGGGVPGGVALVLGGPALCCLIATVGKINGSPSLLVAATESAKPALEKLEELGVGDSAEERGHLLCESRKVVAFMLTPNKLYLRAVYRKAKENIVVLLNMRRKQVRKRLREEEKKEEEEWAEKTRADTCWPGNKNQPTQEEKN